jgi:hypothetical protein
MANQEHLEILMQGVNVWNESRHRWNKLFTLVFFLRTILLLVKLLDNARLQQKVVQAIPS